MDTGEMGNSQLTSSMGTKALPGFQDPQIAVDFFPNFKFVFAYGLLLYLCCLSLVNPSDFDSSAVLNL